MSRYVTPHRVRVAACLALLATLAACGSSHTTRSAAHHYKPSRYYPPPGSASDPWGPYITEASGRFGVPENWIRRVMRQESGGQEDVISWAGAMGLMQVMPDTYDGLRGRYSLGDDPFDPHNNILAGTAYLREMYDRFGSPGFLAAYNAGPNRLDRYLNSGTPLPAETVNYVASIAPLLGNDTPMSGPLAVYAGGATVTRVAFRQTSAGCDPDAAYNPDGPCTPLAPAVQAAPVVAAPVVAAPYAAASAPYVEDSCDPDAAYDPTRPCRPAGQASPPAYSTPMPDPGGSRYASARPYAPEGSPALGNSYSATNTSASPGSSTPGSSYAPSSSAAVANPYAPRSGNAAVAPSTSGSRFSLEARPIQERMAQPAAFSPGPAPGRWMIQVGAFATLSIAEAAAENARSAAPDLLRTTKIELPATTPFGNQVAFRARLSGLSAPAAAQACSRLTSRGMACMTVPPPRDLF